jgi:hypothetical protein
MRWNYRLAAATALLMACAISGSAYAEVRVSGNENDIALHANNATVAEILSGVQSALHIKILLKGSIPRQITGDYSGSLRRVLSRLMDGTSYIVSSNLDGLVITVLAQTSSRPAAAGVQAPLAGRAAQPGVATEPVPAVVAAADDTSVSGPQGWMPTEDPFKAYRTAPSPPPGTQTPVPQAEPAQQRPIVAENDNSENNSVQGWMPTSDPFAAYRSGASTPAPSQNPSTQAASAQPVPSGAANDDSENNTVQGWMPTGDPFAAYRSKGSNSAPSQAAPKNQASAGSSAKANPPIPDFSGFRPMGMMMDDSQDRPPALGAQDGPTLPGGQGRSSKLPSSLAPMVEEPAWAK